MAWRPSYGSYGRASTATWDRPSMGWDRQSVATDRTGGSHVYRGEHQAPDPNQGLKMCVNTMRGIITDMRNISATLAGPDAKAFTTWRKTYPIRPAGDVVASSHLRAIMDEQAGHRQTVCQEEIRTLTRYFTQCQMDDKEVMRDLELQLSKHKERVAREELLSSDSERQLAQQRVAQLTNQKERLLERLDALNTQIVDRPRMHDEEATSPDTSSVSDALKTQIAFLEEALRDLKQLAGTNGQNAVAKLNERYKRDIERLKREQGAKRLFVDDAVAEESKRLTPLWLAACSQAERAAKEEKESRETYHDAAVKLECVLEALIGPLASDVKALRAAVTKGPVDRQQINRIWQRGEDAATVLCELKYAVWEGGQLVMAEPDPL